MEITILKEREPEALKTLNKLIKRAKKTGNTDISAIKLLEKTVERQVPVNDDGDYWENTFNTITETYEVCVYEVTGVAPQYHGYTLLARIEFMDGIQIINRAPDSDQFPLNEKYLKTSCFCDHCKTDRKRNDVYIVQDKQGEQKQIGRTCLRDYLGIDNPERIFGRFAFFKELAGFDEFERSVRGQKPVYDVNKVLEYCASAIRTHGYVSRKMVSEGFNGITTSGRVQGFLRSVKKTKEEDMLYVTDEDKELSAKVKEYIMTLDNPKHNEFIINLQTLLGQKTVRDHMFGYISAAFPMYARAMDQLKEYEKKTPSEFVGIVGEKTILELTVTKTRLIESMYGSSMLIIFDDGKGNVLTAFYTGQDDYKEGKTYKVSGRIKEHKIYNNQNQTALTRIRQKSK